MFIKVDYFVIYRADYVFVIQHFLKENNFLNVVFSFIEDFCFKTFWENFTRFIFY